MHTATHRSFLSCWFPLLILAPVPVSLCISPSPTPISKSSFSRSAPVTKPSNPTPIRKRSSSRSAAVTKPSTTTTEEEMGADATALDFREMLRKERELARKRGTAKGKSDSSLSGVSQAKGAEVKSWPLPVPAVAVYYVGNGASLRTECVV